MPKPKPVKPLTATQREAVVKEAKRLEAIAKRGATQRHARAFQQDIKRVRATEEQDAADAKLLDTVTRMTKEERIKARMKRNVVETPVRSENGDVHIHVSELRTDEANKRAPIKRLTKAKMMEIANAKHELPFVVPPKMVSIKTNHADGSPHSDGGRMGDSLIEIFTANHRDMIERLRHLAVVLASTHDDLEGSGLIIILRSKK